MLPRYCSINKMKNCEKKIGIMGGTFDPPHLGHLISAEYVADELSLNEVVFVPTGNFSYKDSDETAEAWHRYDMVKLAIASNPKFSISDIEVKEDEYSYTCFTLEKIRKIYSNSHIFFIIGADSLDYIDEWKNPQHIFEQCTVVAVSRTGFSQNDLYKKREELLKKYYADIIILQMPNIQISSTDIRRRLRENKSIKYLVDSDVEAYIKSNNLYK